MQERTREVERESSRRADHGTKASVVRRAPALTVGAANDVAEREADDVADRVVANLGFGSPVDEVTSTRIEPSAMAQRSVIRRLTTKAADLDAAMGKSKKGVLGAGKSGYAVIGSTLAKYEKAKAGDDPGAASPILERLERLCTTWLNEHHASVTEQDVARRKVVSRLHDEIAMERVKASQMQAHDTYLANLAADQVLPGAPTPMPVGDKHKFKATTGTSRTAGAKALDEFAGEVQTRQVQFEHTGSKTIGQQVDKLKARQQLVKDKGLTKAEHAAIMVYTEAGGDYNYMNPAATNSKTWLAKNKATEKARAGKNKTWGRESDQTLYEEGALHTAVATSGLNKLDAYKAVTYRGQSFTEDKFKADIAVGKMVVLPHIVSTSKAVSTALGFAMTNLSDPAKVDKSRTKLGGQASVLHKLRATVSDIAVLWLYDPTSGGKDIEALSTLEGEGEVAFVPGTKLVIATVTEVKPADEAPPPLAAPLHTSIKAAMAAGNFAKARKIYIVHVLPAPKAKAPAPPVPKKPTATGGP